MDEATPPAWRRPRRTVVALTALVVLAGAADVLRDQPQPGAGSGQPLVVEGCDPTPEEPGPGAAGAVDARLVVTYRPDDAAPGAPTGATAGAQAGAQAGVVPEVRVAGVVESVGDGLALQVQPCQSVAAALYGALPDGSVVEATVTPGRLRVGASSGGRVDLVDSASGARAIHGGADGFTGFGGWYAVMTDPVPGAYRWRSAVTWRAGSDVVGRGVVDVRLLLGPAPR